MFNSKYFSILGVRLILKPMPAINSNRLFWASCMALVVTSMTFAIRAALIGPLGEQFGLTNTEMGWIVGTAFWGFTLAMVIGGPLCDVIGMRRLLHVAFIGHLAGIVLTIFASGFWSLFISTLLVGIANGMVEAACNPLVATLYPTDKTKMLNRFHVWFPGGLVIGGLVAYALEALGWGWQLQMASMFIPLAVYGFLFFGQQFPPTERVTMGVSYRDMFRAVLTPLFLFMVACMLLTAATELGTNQWIAELLGAIDISSILVLVFISGIMALGRFFAGPIVHRLSSTGVLLFSAVFSGLGLLLLSWLSGYTVLIGAAVFAVGITYFWPTMLGFVAENVPRSGALGLAIMGGAGMLSTSLILPLMGSFYDQNLVKAAADVLPETLNWATEVSKAKEGTDAYDWLQQVKQIAGPITLRYMAVLPLILVAAFGGFLVGFSTSKKQATAAAPAQATEAE